MSVSSLIREWVATITSVLQEATKEASGNTKHTLFNFEYRITIIQNTKALQDTLFELRALQSYQGLHKQHRSEQFYPFPLNCSI